MSIHEKIVKLAKEAEKKAERIFAKTQAEIIANISLHLEKRSNIGFNDLDIVIEDHSEAASVLDAVENILEQLPLRGLISKPTDYRLHGIRDQGDIKTFLKNVEGENSKGCVYVAWSSKPFEFLYIGKAGADQGGNIKRLTDPRHNDLKHALQTAQYLSLIHTKRTTPGSLYKLEACLIELYYFLRKNDFIKGRKDRYLPIHNSQRPKKSLHQGEAFNEIKRIIRNLTNAADAISRKEYGPKDNISLPQDNIFNAQATTSIEESDPILQPLYKDVSTHTSEADLPSLPEPNIQAGRFFKTYKSASS